MRYLFVILILSSFSVTALAATLPICERERDIATNTYLAKHLSGEQIESILNLQKFSTQVQKVRNQGSPECDASIDENSQGLKTLVSFIETDFKDISSALLQDSSLSEKAEANIKGQEAYKECVAREEHLNRVLFAEAKLAYNDKVPGVEKISPGFNAEGLKGFIRTSGDTKTFAFAGSQTLLDWTSNFTTKGGSQLALAMKLKLNEAVNWVKAGKKLQCTGHSLGGGIAESFCARVMMEVRKSQPTFGDFKKDDRIKVVTFNALGGKGPWDANAQGAPRLPPASSWMVTGAIHYRVEGDPLKELEGVSPYLMGTVVTQRSNIRVPRTGTQVGTFFTNRAKDISKVTDNIVRALNGKKQDNTKINYAKEEYCAASDDAFGAHSMEAVESIVSQGTGACKKGSSIVVVDPV